MSSLKWIRVAVAALFLVPLTVLFLDFSEKVPTDLHWLAHFQIVPALLMGGVGLVILAVLAVVTLLFGRMYCSAICPLGILQDLFSRTARPLMGKKAGYRFRPEMTPLRWGLLAVFLVSLLGFPLAVSLLDPYSHFGRIAASLLRPVFLGTNNLLAGFGMGGFSYRSIHVEMPAVLVALAALLLVGVLAVFFGRRYCNTICPVGTLLGLLSRFSLFQVRLKGNCVSCGRCEKACKGECIDSKAKTVDSSRCVACFNCLSTCRLDALTYSPSWPLVAPTKEEPLIEQQAACVPVAAKTNDARRRFLGISCLSFLLPPIAASMGASRSSPPPDPSLPAGTSRESYEMTVPILPPGAVDRKRFQSKCTACHLCVTKCPASILRPSTTELGLSGFLQPVVKFDHGFCNYDCRICTEVCPSRALIKIETKEEKHRLQIGTVKFLENNCVVVTQGTNCGACAEHCPTGAVKMVPHGKPEAALTIPVVDAELCIGCGACEHICPVRPYRAIYIEGLAAHREAKLAYDPNAKQEEVQLDDFGF